MSTSRKYRCLFCLTFAITLLQLGLTAPLPTDSGKATEEGGGLTLGSILSDVESSTSTPASTTPPILASTQLKTTSSPTSDAAKTMTTPLNKAWNPGDLVKPASLVRGARYQTEDGKESRGKGKAAVQLDYEISLGNNEKQKVAKIEKLFEKMNDYLVCTYEDQKDCDEKLVGKHKKDTKLPKAVMEEKSDGEHKAPNRPVYWWERRGGKNQAPLGHWFVDHPRALHDEPLGGVMLHPGRRYPPGSSVYGPEGYYSSPFSSFPVSHRHKPVYGLRNVHRRHPGYFGDHFGQHPEWGRRPYAGFVGFRRRQAGIEHPLHRGVMSERDLKRGLLELEAIRNGERVQETKELPRQHRREKENEKFPVHSHGWEQEYEMPPVKPMDSKFVAHKMPYGRTGQQPIFYGHVGKPSRTPEFREEMLHDFWPKKYIQEENAVREGYAYHGRKMAPFWTYANANPPQDKETWQSQRVARDRKSEFNEKTPESYDEGWRRWANKLRARKRLLNEADA